MNKYSRSFFYAGLFVVSFCLLACQFLLTRILSLVFSYHFVFLIISSVMFGLTLGALIVYWAKKRISLEKNFEYMALFSFFSGISLCLSDLSLFYLPAFLIQKGIAPQTVIYLYVPLLTVPFIFFGIVLSSLLTRFPQIIGKVYAVNLAGSAAGCIGAYFILDSFNAFAAACVLAILCLSGSILFLIASGTKSRVFFIFYEILLMLVLWTACFNQAHDCVQATWAKDRLYTSPPLYSKLNFFSYVSVRSAHHRPFGWGYSTKVQGKLLRAQELMILIDEGAGTVLTKFHDFSDLWYLKYDISNLVYRIRSFDSVFVIGSGGGRDLLAAALFGAKKIVGVELNKDIMDIVLEKSVLFSGNIKRIPQIKIYNDDARAFIARSHDKYDLIQSSLVDAFSASALGSFALSENNLYTKEAWVIYLRHLTDQGVLTFARWYTDDRFEIYRLLSLAQSSLKEVGIEGNLRDHIALIRTKTSTFDSWERSVPISKLEALPSLKGTRVDPEAKNSIWEADSPGMVRLKAYYVLKPEEYASVTDKDFNTMVSYLEYYYNVGVILVSKTPFSKQELDALDKACDDLGFEVVLNARKSVDENFDRILSGNYRLTTGAGNISPTTDDRPFYFYFSNIKNFFSHEPIGKGTVVLRQTSILIVILGFLFIIFPFIFTPQRRGFGNIEFWHGVYFTSIGWGFMFLEIPLIQRLGLFLGHPVYGLTVVLFSLLLACGAGSFMASKITIKQVLGIMFPSLLFLILCMDYVLPVILWQATPYVIPVKIVISGFLVSLAGLFMGVFFPTGVTVVSRNHQAPLIFYWAINGFSSMCAAAIATIFLINLGFHATLLLAFLFYGLAFYALIRNKT